MPIYYDLESPLSILAFVHFIFGFGTKSAVPEVGLDRETGIRRTALGSWIRIVFLFVSNGRLERDRFEGFLFLRRSSTARQESLAQLGHLLGLCRTRPHLVWTEEGADRRSCRLLRLCIDLVRGRNKRIEKIVELAQNNVLVSIFAS